MSTIPKDKYYTDDTKFAAYLIQDGFRMLNIVFVKGKYDKVTGNFVFDALPDDPILLSAKYKYDFGEAYPNLDRYEKAKESLIDRIKSEINNGK